MPDLWFDVDSALSEVPVNILPLLDDTDFKTRETSIAYNASGMDLVWNFVTTAGAYTQTAVTPTTGGNYDWAHQGDGMYSIEIPASGGASINNDTEGFGWFTGLVTGVLPWRGPTIGFRAAAINNSLVDGTTIDVNVTALSGDTTAADNSEAFFDGTGYAGTNNVIPTVTNLTNAPTNGDLTATMKTSVTTAATAATPALSAAGVSAIWDKLTSALTAAGSVGKLIVDNLNAPVATVDTVVDAIKVKTDYLPSATAGAAGGVFIAGSNAATSITTALTANITGNLSGSVGSVTGAVGSVTGAVGSVTGSVGSVTGNVGGNVVGSVASVVGNVGGNVVGSVASVTNVVAANLTQILGTALTETSGYIAAAFKKFFNVGSPTGTVNSIPDAVAGAAGGLFIAGSNAATTVNITGNLSGSVGSVTGAVGSVTGNVGGNVTGSVGSVTGAVGSVTGAVGSVTAGVTLADDAITSAKYDESTAFPVKSADTGATQIARVGADGDTLETLSDQIDAISASAIADAVWDEALAGHSGAGSAGLALSGASAPTAAAVADAVWDEAISGHLGAGSTGNALNAAGSAGDPWSAGLPGAYGAGTAGYIVGTNLNAPVGTIDTVVDAIKAKTDNLPASPAAVGSQMDLVNAPNATAVTAIQNGLATAAALTAVDDYVDTEVAAIKAVTDKLDTALEADSAVYRFTTNALEQAPTGGSAPTVVQIRQEMDANSTQLAAIVADTNELQVELADGGRTDLLIDGIKAKTDNLPASPAAVGSQMDLVNAPNATAVTAIQSGLATAAALTAVDDYVDTEVAAIKAVTDKLDTTLELDSAVYRFTTNALEQAPTGGSAPTVEAIRTEMDTNSTKLANLDATVSSRLATAGYTTPPTVTQIRQEMDANSTRLDTTVSSRLATSGYTAPDNSSITAIKAKTDNLPADPASNTQVATRLASASYTAPDNASISAIKAKTDNLPASPAATGAKMDFVDAPNATAITAIQNGLATSADISAVDTVVDAIDLVTEKLDGMLEYDVDQEVYRYTQNALEETPSGSGGDSAASIATAVWASSTRTLTQNVSQVAAATSTGTLAITASTTYTQSITGLGNIMSRTKLWLTIKANEADTDSEAIVQLMLSNPTSAENDGLLVLNGAAGMKAYGSLAVTDATLGNITITLSENATKELAVQSNLFYDIKIKTSTGVRQLARGTANINTSITLATS